VQLGTRQYGAFVVKGRTTTIGGGLIDPEICSFVLMSIYERTPNFKRVLDSIINPLDS
jgi:hypothetical protein